MDTNILGHERLQLRLSKGVSIELEIFEVPEGFKSIAWIDDQQYEELDGYGFHTDKDKSVHLAIIHLIKLMKKYRKSF
ncbi:hypothetical protein [Bacillus sp. FJAT-29814]|uniref:hypothetical protein n=1 Tax=Bacillus sp. FJAT-29814 TaxID=1729688 RepID=UPI000829D2F6|nr:hypothetical protein [Bacillus sp. FJAT-29814]